MVSHVLRIRAEGGGGGVGGGGGGEEGGGTCQSDTVLVPALLCGLAIKEKEHGELEGRGPAVLLFGRSFWVSPSKPRFPERMS